MKDIILGIDPGLHVTGYGILAVSKGTINVLEGGVVRTDPRHALAQRLKELAAHIRDLLCQYAPDVLAIEDLYVHKRYVKTAVIMAHARGVIIAEAGWADVEVIPYPATTVKQVVTGYGRASKTQVQEAVQRRLHLREPPHPVDISDAFALAICHASLKERQPEKI